MKLAALAGALVLASDPDTIDAIASQVGTVSHEVTFGQVDGFAAAHPHAAETSRALLLAAQLRRTDGRDDLARSLLERSAAAAPGSPFALDATLGLADLDLTQWSYQSAIKRYQAVLESGSGRWEYQARMGLAAARAARTRHAATVGICGALLVLGVWRAVRAAIAKTLWPMPEEARVALPVAALLGLTSLGQPPSEAHAVLGLAAAGAALLWINAAWFAARPPMGRRRWFEAGLSVAQAAAVLFCTVVLSDLWPRFVDTMASGAGE